MRRTKANSVYDETEKRLLDAAAKVAHERHFLGVRVCDITREAGLSNSAFYVHYNSLSDMMYKYETAVLDGTNNIIKKEEKAGVNVERLYRNVLLSLCRHREELDVIAATKNVDLPLKVIGQLKPYIMSSWNNYGEELNERIFRAVEFLFIAEISLWRDEQYSVDAIQRHISRLMYFTVNAPRLFSQIYYK